LPRYNTRFYIPYKNSKVHAYTTYTLYLFDLEFPLQTIAPRTLTIQLDFHWIFTHAFNHYSLEPKHSRSLTRIQYTSIHLILNISPFLNFERKFRVTVMPRFKKRLFRAVNSVELQQIQQHTPLTIQPTDTYACTSAQLRSNRPNLSHFL